MSANLLLIIYSDTKLIKWPTKRMVFLTYHTSVHYPLTNYVNLFEATKCYFEGTKYYFEGTNCNFEGTKKYFEGMNYYLEGTNYYLEGTK